MLHVCSSSRASASQHVALWDSWTRDRRNAANSRGASRKLRSRDEHPIPLGRRRTTFHASACEGIDVGIRCGEAVRKRFQENDELVLLLIRQVELTDRHVQVILDLGPRPAGYFFD